MLLLTLRWICVTDVTLDVLLLMLVGCAVVDVTLDGSADNYDHHNYAGDMSLGMVHILRALASP